jgi:hypothetical protein
MLTRQQLDIWYDNQLAILEADLKDGTITEDDLYDQKRSLDADYANQLYFIENKIQ